VGGVVGGPAFAFGGRAGLELVEVLLEAEADERLLVGLAEDEVEEEGEVGAGLGGVGDVEADRDPLLASLVRRRRHEEPRERDLEAT
jgi:hypothetical protein